MNTKSFSSLAGRLAALWLMALSTAPAQTGVPLWTNRYAGPSNSTDYAFALAVDSNGNVIAAGFTAPDFGISGRDWLILKYSGAGEPLWTNRYNGPGNGLDAPNAVTVDSIGNVFVTGTSVGNDGSEDYLLIKYSGAGVPLWTNHYNGPGNGSDGAGPGAVDSGGNVFVTGISLGRGSPTDYDYATIKYSGAGVPLWTNRYNGPGNDSDSAIALALDSSGNVFVTGTSFGGGNPGYDYATIKYSGAGVPLWTNRYRGSSDSVAQALAVDGGGNAIVTGFAETVYVTIKYSASGLPLWTNFYAGVDGMTSNARDVAVDSIGNVIVTGYSWDANSTDYATVAYSSAGVPLWTNRYGGPGNSGDAATAVVVDANGNVIVTGVSNDSDGVFLDYLTIKYSGAGVPLWTNRYNGHDGPGNTEDQATAVAVDGNGNVFVTGYSVGADGSYDFVTIKYSGAGLVPIPLNHQIVANQLVLSWTNAAFSLQSAPAVQGDYTNISNATSPHTNSLSAAQRYFRLRGN